MTVNNGSPGLPDPLRDRTPHGGLSECSWRSGALGVARKVDRHNWRACMVENGRKQLQLHAFHDACSWLLFAGMSDAKCRTQACHGIQAAVTARRRTFMLPEAPVASREARALPVHLTCLPGRAAWGVWLPAPHVKDSLLGCWTIWNSHLGPHWSGPRAVAGTSQGCFLPCPAAAAA